MSDLHYRGMPQTVRIGCYVFRIECSEFEDSEAEGTFGHMNPISQKIRMRPGMTPQNLANTFIHEVMHGIYWFQSCGQFSFGAGGTSSQRDIEEEFVTKGANGLCAFWQDNPRAVNWWARLLKIKEET
jgi:hypothetical protein